MLSRRDLEKELGKGINIVPLCKDNFKENSINLSVSTNAWSLKGGTVYWYGGGEFSVERKGSPKKECTIQAGKSACRTFTEGQKKREYVILFPHQTTIIETKEVIGIGANIGGTVHSKVGVSAKGIGHIGTMLGPGFCGHLMIALHNITDDVVALKVGSTFVSLVFNYLETQVIRTSATMSGHVDKFLNLGIKADEDTIQYLKQDWKSNIDGVRDMMIKTKEYKEYREYIKKNQWKEIRKYFTKRNAIAVLSAVGVMIALNLVAQWADSKLVEPVWVDRYWNIGYSGVLGTVFMGFFRFLKDKK